MARPSPLLDGLPEVRQAIAESADDAVGDSDTTAEALRSRLAPLGDQERDRVLVELVRSAAAIVLGHAATDAVPADRPFRDLGFDSLTAVELRNHLGRATGLRLPATLAFDQPTPAVLAGYLKQHLVHDADNALPTAEELDRLETILTTRSPDDIGRTRIVMRLQGLLSKLSGTQDAVSVADRLDAVSDEELFDLVDRDLGL
ncbi:phosphopantetheine-binding protein [Nonomuraea sp. NBC_01738]|nr:phosphopantetheine-binding protein [Nonomuraea sp. NBC_01738]